MVRPSDLRASLALLGVVLAIALTGLAADGNWPKVIRVAAAGLAYALVLELAMRVWTRGRPRAAGTPFLPFVMAGSHAGLVSGLLRPVLDPVVIATGAVAAGTLLGGVHFLALRRWERLRLAGVRAVPAPPGR